jgi:hypothetical protein
MTCYDMDEFVLNQEICWADYLQTNTIMPVRCTVYMTCYDMDEFVLNQEICWAEYLQTNTIMPEECTLPVPHAFHTFICH